MPRVIIKWKYLKIKQKQEKEKDNYLNVSKQQCFFLGVPIYLVGAEGIHQNHPYQIDKQIEGYFFDRKAIAPRKEITKACNKKQV
jgi:hypothetical protein